MAIFFHCPWDNADEFTDALLRLDAALDIRVWPEIGATKDIDVAVVWDPPPGALARLPNLKCVAALGAGVDHILKDPSYPGDVPIVRVVDPVMVHRMSEYVLAAVLRHHRRFGDYAAQQHERRWRKLPQPDAGEVRVGIMGLGALGADAARRLAGLGFDVAGWSRSPKRIGGIAAYHGADGLAAFLARTDILVCLLPLTPATRGILDRTAFDAMPRGAYLVNVARGAHLVETDLTSALDDGRVAGATLDVFAEEPLPPGHPFWSDRRILITPHVSSLTNPRTAAEQILDNIRRARAGEPLLNAVDPAAGY